MVSTLLLNQIGEIAGGDLTSNLGIIQQAGSLFTREGYEIAGVKIDTVSAETHDSTMQVTSYPVEAGFEVTDHIYANPQVVSVTGVVSDIEVGDFISVGAVAESAANDILPTYRGDQQTRSQQTWAKLIEIQQQGQLLDLVTHLRTYVNMAILGLSTQQDANTANEIRFTMALREIFIVETETFQGDIGTLLINNPRSETAKNNQGTADRLASRSDKGKVQGTPSNNDNPSILRRTYNAVFEG